MIKHKGNIEKLIKELENNKNNALAFLYKNASFKDGVLSGATITIKDTFATNDAPTQASSKILDGFKPSYDATIVSKLRKSGAAIVAKVHNDELALGGTGLLSAYGSIVNPLDDTRLAGGSSSGSVATFTNAVSVSIGSDTGDSVRMPASYAGITGFKPSYGAISRYGLFAFASSLDTVGYFAHNVSDIITTSQVLFGKDEKDFSSKEIAKPELKTIKPKKVIILEFDGMPEYIQIKINKLENKLKTEGIEIVHKSLSKKLQELIGIVYSAISFAEASSNDANLTGIIFGKREDGSSWEEIMTNTRSANLGKMVQRRFALGSFFLLAENQSDIFIQAQKVRAMINKEMTEFANDADILINPANVIAPLITEEKEDTPFANNLAVSNFTGQPNIVIPFGRHNNMPFGLSLLSALYKDKKLLSFALYIENIIGGDYE